MGLIKGQITRFLNLYIFTHKKLYCGPHINKSAGSGANGCLGPKKILRSFELRYLKTEERKKSSKELIIKSSRDKTELSVPKVS